MFFSLQNWTIRKQKYHNLVRQCCAWKLRSGHCVLPLFMQCSWRCRACKRHAVTQSKTLQAEQQLKKFIMESGAADIGQHVKTIVSHLMCAEKRPNKRKAMAALSSLQASHCKNCEITAAFKYQQPSNGTGVDWTIAHFNPVLIACRLSVRGPLKMRRGSLNLGDYSES